MKKLDTFTITTAHEISIGQLISVNGEDRVYQVIARSGMEHTIRVAPWYILSWSCVKAWLIYALKIILTPFRNYYDDILRIIE